MTVVGSIRNIYLEKLEILIWKDQRDLFGRIRKIDLERLE